MKSYKFDEEGRPILPVGSMWKHHKQDIILICISTTKFWELDENLTITFYSQTVLRWYEQIA